MKFKKLFFSLQILLNAPDVSALYWQKAEPKSPSHRYP